VIKAAVWIDRETELICAYVSLAGHDVVATDLWLRQRLERV